MSTLILELNKIYLDEKRNHVTLVRQYNEDDADYRQGFRFRGDNGYSYQADGTTVGRIGGVTISQMGSFNLISEVGHGDETLHLRPVLDLGKIYRNHIGKPVIIIAKVDPVSSWYQQGFRFMDERGSFYTEHGSMQSKLYAKLNIVSEIGYGDLTDQEYEDLKQRERANLATMQRRSGAHAFCDRRLPTRFNAFGKKLVDAVHPRVKVMI